MKCHVIEAQGRYRKQRRGRTHCEPARIQHNQLLGGRRGGGRGVVHGVPGRGAYVMRSGSDGRPVHAEFRIGDYQAELGIIDRNYGPPGPRPSLADVPLWRNSTTSVSVRAMLGRATVAGYRLLAVRSCWGEMPGTGFSGGRQDDNTNRLEASSALVSILAFRVSSSSDGSKTISDQLRNGAKQPRAMWTGKYGKPLSTFGNIA